METEPTPAAAQVEAHRQHSLAYEEHGQHLAAKLARAAINSEEYRRLNQRVGFALKMSSVHAHLAIAVATIATEPATPSRWEQVTL